jgi:hypothetical protein
MEQLLTEIRTYCLARDITLATFGAYAVGDGKFCARIDAGGECLPRTAKRARAYMRDNPAKQGAA